MLVLLGTIFGLLGSLLPECLKFFNNKEDHKHELEMAKLQMEQMKLQGEIKITELNATADIEEVKAMYAAAKVESTGWKFMDGIISLYNSSVRPTFAYIFLGVYCLVKYAIFMSYTQAGYDWMTAVRTIWGSEDFAVFSTIIAFFFGGRFLKYSLERIKGK
jgi:hypothetical protein